MSTTQYIVGAIGDLAAWVLGGLLLFWLLRLVLLLVGMSPLSPRAKASVLRFGPVVELLVVVAYAAAALVELLTEEPEFAWVLIALVITLVAFSWSALYDLVLGVAFRVARVCQVGDLVHVDEITGRVLEVGARALVLQTRDGDEAVVPYGRIARRTLRRTQSVSGAYVHSFVLQPPEDQGFAELKRRVIEAAMRCHWASAVHEAKVERRAGGTVEVSVFAHDADHAPIVEAAVRRALSEAPPEPGPEPAAKPKPGSRSRVRTPAPGQPPEDGGVPSVALDEDPSDVMDLRTVLGPRIPPPPPPTGKK